MTPGKAFQWGHGAAIELTGSPSLGDANSIAPGCVPRAVAPKPQPQEIVAAPVQPPQKPAKQPRRRSIVAQAKTRATEIRKELRRLGKLQAELEQLERLIAAADGKSPAPVRAIGSAKRTG